jgi:hypothetical protein
MSSKVSDVEIVVRSRTLQGRTTTKTISIVENSAITSTVKTTTTTDNDFGCSCIGCTRIESCTRCDVCVNTKKRKNCLLNCCSYEVNVVKDESIAKIDRLISDCINNNAVSDGMKVCCRWHANGVCSVYRCLSTYRIVGKFTLFVTIGFSRLQIFSAGVGEMCKNRVIARM